MNVQKMPTDAVPMPTVITPREDTTVLVIRDTMEMERIVNQVNWQASYSSVHATVCFIVISSKNEPCIIKQLLYSVLWYPERSKS